MILAPIQLNNVNALLELINKETEESKPILQYDSDGFPERDIFFGENPVDTYTWGLRDGRLQIALELKKLWELPIKEN